MEVFVFHEDNVEATLDEVRGSFIILNFALYGLLKSDLISQQEFSAFENILNRSSLQIDDLMKNLRPIATDDEIFKRLSDRVHNPISSNTQSDFNRTPCLKEHS